MHWFLFGLLICLLTNLPMFSQLSFAQELNSTLKNEQQARQQIADSNQQINQLRAKETLELKACASSFHRFKCEREVREGNEQNFKQARAQKLSANTWLREDKAKRSLARTDTTLNVNNAAATSTDAAAMAANKESFSQSQRIKRNESRFAAKQKRLAERAAARERKLAAPPRPK